MGASTQARPSGVRTVPGPALHLPAFAEGLRRLGARDCLMAHVRRPADLAIRISNDTPALAYAGA